VTYERTSDLPQRSGSFQAMVRAGDSVTSYLRTGKGEPVVLLRRTRHLEPLWGIVLAEVSHSFRAIVPEHAPDGEHFATWFRSFLDGLGLGAVRVVSDAHFGMCCVDAGVLDPDWLSVLVVLAESGEAQRLAHLLEANQAPAVTTALVLTDDADAYGVAERALVHLGDSRRGPGG